MHALALTRLLRLASPALPVGAYSYSQGLESAIALGWVADEAGLHAWIGDALDGAQTRFDAPLLVRLHRAWEAGDLAAVRRWNELLLAARETAELRAESIALGQSLVLLMQRTGELAAEGLQRLQTVEPVSSQAALACVAVHWQIPAQPFVIACLFTWVENQVQVAVKCACIGHVAGQRLLSQASERLPELVGQAIARDDAALSNSMPGLAIASSLHETAAQRLFRS